MTVSDPTSIHEEVQVENIGSVRLDGFMADDLSVVNSARVSFANKKIEMEEDDKGLIRFLMREKHGTPFEHNAFRWHVRCPIFVAREWFRHRIGSFNEFSMRYAYARTEFYVPDEWRTQVGKPGAYHYEDLPRSVGANAAVQVAAVYNMAEQTYKRLIDMGVAREQARIILPVGITTEFYWTVNARSLMNFLRLRNDENAQAEIRWYAQVIEGIWAKVMPVTHEAFIDFEREGV